MNSLLRQMRKVEGTDLHLPPLPQATIIEIEDLTRRVKQICQKKNMAHLEKPVKEM